MMKKFIKRLITSTGSVLAEAALSKYYALEAELPKFGPAPKYVACRTTFGHMLVHRDDRIIGGGFRSYGDFDTYQVTEVLTVLRQFISDLHTRCFLDIGANIGGHGIFALERSFQRAIFIGNIRLTYPRVCEPDTSETFYRVTVCLEPADRTSTR